MLTPGRATRLFALWLVFRTAAWAVVATVTQAHPPLDTVEWLAWGREWQLGYHKHPPLGAWVMEVAYRLAPGGFVGVYLAGYGFVAVALWAVWRLARRVVSPGAALASVVCLDGLVFLGQAAAEVNNQVPLIAFWALAVYGFHVAWETDRWRDWVGVGVALGLGALCKYSIAFLAAPLLVLWVWQNGARRWTRPAVVAAVAAAVFAPHLAWLWEHDFPTLRYAALRAQGDAAGPPSRWSGLAFLGSQAVRLVPVGLVLVPVLGWRWGRGPSHEPPPGSGPLASVGGEGEGGPGTGGAGRPSDRAFLLTAALGPVAFHLVAAAGLRLQLRDIWGAPLWTFTGLLAVYLVGVRQDVGAWRRLGAAWGCVLGAWLGVTGWANLAGQEAPKISRVQYPGAELAEAVCGRYEARHGAPPAIIAGDWWLAGSVCCLAPHRPSLYGSLEPARAGMDLKGVKGDPERYRAPLERASPWAGDEVLRRRGGVIVWDAGAFGDGPPAWLKGRFPSARPEAGLELRGGLRVGWASVPPGG